MEEKIEVALKKCKNVREMLEGIPRQLWEVFMPQTVDEFQASDDNFRSFKARESEREKVIALQRLYSFPPRPNATVRDTITRIMIEKYKRRMRRSQSPDPKRDW